MPKFGREVFLLPPILALWFILWTRLEPDRRRITSTICMLKTLLTVSSIHLLVFNLTLMEMLSDATVWKLQNFSVTQILREIKVGQSVRSSLKIYHFNMNFCPFWRLTFAKFTNSEPLNRAKRNF